jgi:carbon-monoxide dehydrogenase small subunit
MEGDPVIAALKQAFNEMHGLQCGYCTPAMLMSSCALLTRNANPTEHEVRDALHGNLCRCTGYQNIVDAVLLAAGQLQGKPVATGKENAHG